MSQIVNSSSSTTSSKLVQSNEMLINEGMNIAKLIATSSPGLDDKYVSELLAPLMDRIIDSQDMSMNKSHNILVAKLEKFIISGGDFRTQFKINSVINTLNNLPTPIDYFNGFDFDQWIIDEDLDNKISNDFKTLTDPSWGTLDAVIDSSIDDFKNELNTTYKLAELKNLQAIVESIIARNYSLGFIKDADKIVENNLINLANLHIQSILENAPKVWYVVGEPFFRPPDKSLFIDSLKSILKSPAAFDSISLLTDAYAIDKLIIAKDSNAGNLYDSAKLKFQLDNSGGNIKNITFIPGIVDIYNEVIGIPGSEIGILGDDYSYDSYTHVVTLPIYIKANNGKFKPLANYTFEVKTVAPKIDEVEEAIKNEFAKKFDSLQAPHGYPLTGLNRPLHLFREDRLKAIENSPTIGIFESLWYTDSFFKTGLQTTNIFHSSIDNRFDTTAEANANQLSKINPTFIQDVFGVRREERMGDHFNLFLKSITKGRILGGNMHEATLQVELVDKSDPTNKVAFSVLATIVSQHEDNLAGMWGDRENVSQHPFISSTLEQSVVGHIWTNGELNAIASYGKNPAGDFVGQDGYEIYTKVSLPPTNTYDGYITIVARNGAFEFKVLNLATYLESNPYKRYQKKIDNFGRHNVYNKEWLYSTLSSNTFTSWDGKVFPKLQSDIKDLLSIIWRGLDGQDLFMFDNILWLSGIKINDQSTITKDAIDKLILNITPLQDIIPDLFEEFLADISRLHKTFDLSDKKDIAAILNGNSATSIFYNDLVGKYGDDNVHITVLGDINQKTIQNIKVFTVNLHFDIDGHDSLSGDLISVPFDTTNNDETVRKIISDPIEKDLDRKFDLFKYLFKSYIPSFEYNELVAAIDNTKAEIIWRISSREMSGVSFDEYRLIEIKQLLARLAVLLERYKDSIPLERFEKLMDMLNNFEGDFDYNLFKKMSTISKYILAGIGGLLWLAGMGAVGIAGSTALAAKRVKATTNSKIISRGAKSKIIIASLVGVATIGISFGLLIYLFVIKGGF